MNISSSINLIRSFIILLKETRDFRNKMVLLKYGVWNFLHRLFKCSSDQSNDIFIEFKEARIWFGPFAGELSSYIEIYVRKDYEQVSDFIPGANDIIFDIGANIGLYTIRQAKRAKNGRVFSFEPNPYAFARLEKNLKANDLHNVFAINKAIFSKHCQLGLKFNGFTGTTVVTSPLRELLKVEALTLDEIVRSYGIKRVNLVKIDVEGNEMEVLRGGEKSLELIDKIVIECHSKQLKEQVSSFLKGKGFSQVLQKKLERTYLLYFKR